MLYFTYKAEDAVGNDIEDSCTLLLEDAHQQQDFFDKLTTAVQTRRRRTRSARRHLAAF